MVPGFLLDKSSGRGGGTLWAGSGWRLFYISLFTNYAHKVLFKGPSSIKFFARLISNSVYENSNLSSVHYDMLARLCNFCM